jgi:hypothetical protein
LFEDVTVFSAVPVSPCAIAVVTANTVVDASKNFLLIEFMEFIQVNL